VPNDNNELAQTLHGSRTMKGLSLRAVADPARISPTYLQKLERGEVKDPSPNILYRLAEQLGLEYGDLMRLAGYVVPVGSTRRGVPQRGSSALSHALSSEPLTSDEEVALTEYLGFLRSKRGGPPSDA
jgi:HTH-type transcriptional regulator, competence development regulator